MLTSNPTPPLRAYHGDEALRASTIASMQEHACADAIIQGRYWDPSARNGCAVACLTHDPNGGHEQYPVNWGIPLELAHIEDRIHEGLHLDTAKAWPVAFLSAIPVGADLSKVWPRFVLELLTDADRGALRLCTTGGPSHAATEQVVHLICRGLSCDPAGSHEWHGAHVATHQARALVRNDTRGFGGPPAAIADAIASWYDVRLGRRAFGFLEVDTEPTDQAYRACGAASAAYAGDRAHLDEKKVWSFTMEFQRHFAWQADVLLQLLSEAT